MYPLLERQLSRKLSIPLEFFDLLRDEGTYVALQLCEHREIRLYQPSILVDNKLILIKIGELVEIQHYSQLIQMSIANALDHGANELIRRLGLPEINDIPHMIMPLARNKAILDKLMHNTGFAKTYCQRLFLLFANGYTGDWGTR